MDKELYYVINPNYLLFNDIHRVVLTGVFEKSRIDTVPYSLNFDSFIHPLQAKMLSFFDGHHPLGETVRRIAYYFGLEEKEILEIITNYIDNESPISIPFQDKLIVFPAHVLVPKDKVTSYRTYQPEMFDIAETLDFSSKRLYVPRHFLFVLSTDCYTNCAYCYADKEHRVTNPLPAKRIIELIDQIEALGGAVNIDCNGGDLLLHPEHLQVLERLFAANYHPLISTKIPLSEEKVARLKAIGMREIQISLDSSNPAVLNALLNINQHDYYQRILESISYLDKAGINVLIHPVLTAMNCDIKEVQKLLDDVLPFKRVKQVHFVPMGYSLFKAESCFTQLKPTQEALSKIEELVQASAEKYPEQEIFLGEVGFLKKDYTSDSKRAELFQARPICSGNRKSIVVLPDGKVTICEELYWHPHFLLGDLTNQQILEVWNSPAALALHNLSQEDISDESACKRCTKFEECRSDGRGVCWKFVQYFYGTQRWDFPEPSCEFAPPPLTNCLI